MGPIPQLILALAVIVAVLALICWQFHFIFLKQSIDLIHLVSYHFAEGGDT